MKILVNGIGGRVGNMLLQCTQTMKDVTIVGGIDKYADPTEYKIPVFKSIFECNIEADIIIDFSRPEALYDLLKYATQRKLGIVIATTGLDDDEQNAIIEASQKIPIFQSSNMSLGVNLLADIAKQTAKFLGVSYDVEIIEQHHRMKVDAPSGTALYLADEINKVFDNNKEYIYGRHTKDDKRSTKDIGIHAIRGGTIVGKHDVMFIGTDEVVTLSHEAQSRKVFANGSLRGAELIKDKEYGMYSMNDIIGSDYAVTNILTTGNTTLINISNTSSEKFRVMLKLISDKGINLDMISKHFDAEGKNTVRFTLPANLGESAYSILDDLKMNYSVINNTAKLLIVGAGMAHKCGVAEDVFSCLAEVGTTIYAVTTSETEISCCIKETDRSKSEKALREHYKISI